MVESIPEKDQFLIAYPNYVLRETVTYPNGGVSRFYDDGVDMVIIDDEICSCREGEQIFPCNIYETYNKTEVTGGRLLWH